MENKVSDAGNRAFSVRLLCVSLLLAVVIVLGLASTALAGEAPGTIPGVTYGQADNPPSQWEIDGIPRPLVDSAVEGYWRYLGDGHFTTEKGRDFYWRDGRFVNADGSVMELPASAREHLLSLGIERQPTAEDLLTKGPLSSRPESQETAEPPRTALLSTASWAGRYLHLGALHRTAVNVTGVMADVSVFNRAYDHAEYYMVGLTSPDPDTRVSLQLCQPEWSNTQWIPNVHYYIDGVSYEYDYDSYIFTVGSTAVTKNLKLAYTDTGLLRPYLNNVCMDWGSYSWGYSPSQTASKTQYELGWESRTAVPHDPANHHWNIQNRASNYVDWSYQTSYVSARNVVIDFGVIPAVEYAGLYWFDIQSANYDWLARD